jgi:hypothetical protein
LENWSEEEESMRRYNERPLLEKGEKRIKLVRDF